MIEIKQKITDKVLIVVKSETLRDADLSYANLSDADLRGADLSGANLRDANLRDANLRYADLSYADLSYANLSDADLSGADLSGADLRGADLSGANLRGAKGFIQWQSPQGEKRICCSVKHDKCIMHQLGCFWGNTNEAIKAIREKYGDDSMYEQLLALNAKALEI